MTNPIENDSEGPDPVESGHGEGGDEGVETTSVAGEADSETASRDAGGGGDPLAEIEKWKDVAARALRLK